MKLRYSILVAAALIVFFPLLSRAQWVPTNGPYCGGQVEFLYAHGKIVLAGVRAPMTSTPNLVPSGIFRSTDYGRNWSAVYAAGTQTFFSSILAVGGNLLVGSNQGILKSTDGGRTWLDPDPSLNNLYVASLIKVWYAGRFLLFAETRNRGLFGSTNSGKSWKEVSPKLKGINSLVSCAGKLYAATDTGIIMSRDLGKIWRPAGLRYYPVSNLCVMSNSFLFAQAAGGLFYSTDGGKEWMVINKYRRFGVMNLWAIQGKEIFVLYGDMLLASGDMGGSWSALGAGVYEVTCLCLDGRRLYAGSARYGVFVSTDRGNTWNLSDNGLMTAGILHLASNGNAIFAGSKGFGLYKSTDGGEVWTKVRVNPEEDYAPWDFPVALEASGNMIYARTWTTFLHSSDDGAHWRQLFMYGREKKWFRASLAARGSDVFAGTTDGLLRSTNGGTTWAWSDSGMALGGGERVEPMKAVETVETMPSKKPGIVTQVYVQRIIPPVPAPRHRVLERTLKVVQAVAFAGQKVIAGTTGGEIFASADGGAFWTKLDSNVTDKEFLQFVEVGNDLYAMTEGDGVLRSADGGRTWAKVDDGFTDFDAHVLVHYGRDLFVGTGNGVYYSDDQGNHWTMVNDGLRDSVVVGLTIKGDYLYCGSWDYGVWKRNISDIIEAAKMDRHRVEGIGNGKNRK